MVAKVNVRTPVGGGSLSFPTLNLLLGLLPTQYPLHVHVVERDTWKALPSATRENHLVLFCSAFKRGAVYSVEAGRGAVWLRA
jgi:hypothetical protein